MSMNSLTLQRLRIEDALEGIALALYSENIPNK